MLGLTHTFTPSFLYEFRAGYSRLNVAATSPNQGTNLAAQVGIPGINNYGYNQSGLGLLTITGYTGLGEALTLFYRRPRSPTISRVATASPGLTTSTR